MSGTGSVKSVKKEYGSPSLDHNDSDSYRSVGSPEDQKPGASATVGSCSSPPVGYATGRTQACISSDEEGFTKDSDNEQEAEDVTPWSEIISKYLRGTTRGQMAEYRKLLRPHTCDRSKCKFKRKKPEYRICRRHNCLMSECTRQHKRPNSTGIPQQAGVPNLEQNVMIIPTVPAPTTSTIPITLAPPTHNSSLPGHSATAATMNGLPYPPLYCHDSGLWSTQHTSSHNFPGHCGQLQTLNPTSHYQQAIPLAVPGQYQVRLSVAQPPQPGSYEPGNQYHPTTFTSGSIPLQSQQTIPKTIAIASQVRKILINHPWLAF